MKYLFILDVLLITIGLIEITKTIVNVIKYKKENCLIIVTQKVAHWIITLILFVMSIIMLAITIPKCVEYQNKLDNPNYSEYDYSNSEGIIILDEKKYQEQIKAQYISHYKGLLENSQRNIFSNVNCLLIIFLCLINGKIFIISKDFLIYDKKYSLKSLIWEYRESEKSLLFFEVEKTNSKPKFYLKLNELQYNRVLSYFEENLKINKINNC